jgi:hypothetical protein
MRNWAAYERARGSGDVEQPADGIEHRADLGQWEQRSVSLTVSPPFDDRIARFERYFTREAAALGAERMQRDAAILATLRTNATDDSAASPSTPTGTAG